MEFLKLNIYKAYKNIYKFKGINIFVQTSIFKSYETPNKDIKGIYLKEGNNINPIIMINMTILNDSNLLFAF